MNQYIFQQINREFLKAKKILIISHIQPDGDAYGSALALSQYFSSFKKEVTIFTSDLAPSCFDFLPQVEKISNHSELLNEDWDLVVVLDSGDWQHTGIKNDLFNQQIIINIDHHVTNDNFGDINLVTTSASSTCELIYDFFDNINYQIDKNIACCLLTGIITDTGGLINAATTNRAIYIAGQLVSCGANLDLIINNVTRNKSLAGLKVWGLILSRLKVNQEYNLAYTYVQDYELKKFKIKEDEIDGLINFLNVISSTNGAIFFRINKDNTKVSLRTTKDNIDLAEFASLFGGGGHQKAAGFTLNWRLDNIDEYLDEIGGDLKK